jgi:hypothetical protein
MSGLRWAHQVGPRQVGSIVDAQVGLWVLRREEHTDLAASGTDARSRGPTLQLKGEHEHRAADRLGFRYWGDALVAELTRMMDTDTHSGSLSHGGFVEDPTASIRNTRRRRS